MKLITSLSSRSTTFAALAERALLRELEGGCQVPIGTHGRIEENLLKLDAIVGSLDGTRIVRAKIHGEPEQGEDLGIQLAHILLKSGAKEILESIRGQAAQEIPSAQ
jgi:hydroxymethylbilane synthase